MNSPFHKLLLKSDGTPVKEPLMLYYFVFSGFYSVLARTLGCLNTMMHGESVYNKGSLGERVPTLNVVREVEEMLKQHGFLNSSSDAAYQNFDSSFDFVNKVKFNKQVNSSDADTTLIGDDCNVAEDDVSLSDLDEFVSLMQRYSLED